jgi:hypothetical protein
LAGLVNLAGTHVFSGGTAHLNGDYICTNHPAVISLGTVNFNSMSAVPAVNLVGGTLAASGGYTSRSNSLLNCAMGGTTAGAGFGQLQVGGAVSLNGSLSVDLINGFSPALDDSFTVLTAGTRNGTFANFYYPSYDVTMQLSNAPTSVIVRVTDVLLVPRPELLQPEIVGLDLKLTWTAVSNIIYQVEFNPDLFFAHGPPGGRALPSSMAFIESTTCWQIILDKRPSSGQRPGVWIPRENPG